jgi:TonB family protein
MPARMKRLFALPSCAAAVLAFASAVASAQVGPIEPIILTSAKPSETLANIPELGGDFIIPVEVTVAPDGSVVNVVVTTSSGNEAADQTAIKFMKEKNFLPALDANAQPVEGKARGSVEVKSKTRMKQLKASMKPPNIPNEIERVRKLKCRDFLWEIDRLRRQGASTDLSREIMPWVSLRVYMLDKKLPKDAEAAYLERWPRALAEAEAACKSTPGRLYLDDTLVLILDSLAPNN